MNEKRKFIIKWQGIFAGSIVNGFKIADKTALNDALKDIRKSVNNIEIITLELTDTEAEVIKYYLGDTFPGELY